MTPRELYRRTHRALRTGRSPFSLVYTADGVEVERRSSRRSPGAQAHLARQASRVLRPVTYRAEDEVERRRLDERANRPHTIARKRAECLTRARNGDEEWRRALLWEALWSVCVMREERGAPHADKLRRALKAAPYRGAEALTLYRVLLDPALLGVDL